MAKFKYVALNSKGQETEGVIEAGSQTEAVTAIRERALFPTTVEPYTEQKSAKQRAAKTAKGAKKEGGAMKAEIKLPAFLVRVKSKDLMNFTRQLSTLVNAGLPLLRGLQVLEKQEKNTALKRAISQMGDGIQSGSSFAEALSQHPRIFNKLFVNMAKAGEVGGVLDTVLARLAEFMEKAQQIRNKVISAMVYPVVVLLMAGAIVTFLMIFIVPKFEEIFADMLGGEELPALTQFVMNTSNLFVQRGPLVLAVIVVVVVLLRLIGMSKIGRYIIDYMKLRMPIFGSLTQKTVISRFSRTLGTLMTSGVPVLQALNIVRDTAGNEVVAKAVTRIHDAVKEGENMTPPIENSGIFPPMVVGMTQVGEETGGLPEMLMKVADTYDGEVDNAVAGLTSIIEPILIVMLALIVGTIVIALFMPLISIIGQLS